MSADRGVGRNLRERISGVPRRVAFGLTRNRALLHRKHNALTRVPNAFIGWPISRQKDILLIQAIIRSVNNMNNLELDYFLELQLNMTDIFRYVACHERNFGCFSIRIESSLIDISAFFDSVCQDFIRLRYAEWSVRKKIGGAGAPDAEGFKASNKATKLEEKVSGKAEFNMGDYQTLLEAEFLLSHCEVQLRPYQQNYPSLKCPDGYKLRPYLQWENGHKLSWWEAFTKLKHDRINNFQQATLGNAINALAAVFIVLSFKYQEDFRGGLLVGETYSLFFPLYWTKAGSIMPAVPTWKDN